MLPHLLHDAAEHDECEARIMADRSRASDTLARDLPRRRVR
jgi:hypothetical protein